MKSYHAEVTAVMSSEISQGRKTKRSKLLMEILAQFIFGFTFFFFHIPQQVSIVKGFASITGKTCLYLQSMQTASCFCIPKCCFLLPSPYSLSARGSVCFSFLPWRKTAAQALQLNSELGALSAPLFPSSSLHCRSALICESNMRAG